MADKVAVVTGANKGIGFAIVKELCKRGVGVVYLTARDLSRGQNAVDSLKKEGFNPKFYQLEVTDKNKIKEFAEYLKKEHGGLDILINNAAVITAHYAETTYEDSVQLLDINYYSILYIQEYIYPILKDNARVVNVSSDCGHISNLDNEYWINRLTKEDIKVDDANEFVKWFLDSVKNGTLKNEDFAEATILAYRVSKVALCALTRAQQKEIGRGISINSVHPGFVDTDMTQNSGVLTLEESTRGPIYLALEVDQSVKGRYFWFDKSEKNWSDHSEKLYFTFVTMENRLKELGKM